MKNLLRLIVILITLTLSSNIYAQDCNIKDAKDEFTGERKVITDGTFLNKKKLTKRDTWYIYLHFIYEQEKCYLAFDFNIKYDGSASIEEVYIKLEDTEEILHFKTPGHSPRLDGMKFWTHQYSIFNINSKQLDLLKANNVEKIRFLLPNQSELPLIELAYNEEEAADIRKTAECFVNHINKNENN